MISRKQKIANGFAALAQSRRWRSLGEEKLASDYLARACALLEVHESHLLEEAECAPAS